MRHERKGKVDRRGMFLFPEKGKDFEVQIVAFADGGPTKTLRTVNGKINPIAIDVALLYSPTKLPVKKFLKPARAHAPRNDRAAGVIPTKCTLFAYNGNPVIWNEKSKYPNTPQNELLKAMIELYPNRLSFAEGHMDGLRFEPDVVIYNISSQGEASGGGVFNDAGMLIGITHSSNVLTIQEFTQEENVSLQHCPINNLP